MNDSFDEDGSDEDHVSVTATVAGLPHHPLATDPTGNGWWNRIDRWAFLVSDRLNPILIKEARESLKSQQFLLTFFLSLFATMAWTVLGIVFNSPRVYFSPTGDSLLIGYYFLLAIPIAGMAPLAAYRSLSSELDNDTFELLSITKLASLQIIRGKFASAVLQMMLFFAAVVPSLAFTYLLRGVGVLEIAMIITAILLAGLLLTSFGLMLAPTLQGFAGQTLSMIALMGTLVAGEFLLGAICLDAILGNSTASDPESWMMTGLTAAVFLTLTVLFLKTAAAQIAPINENRSTSIRIWMVLAQLEWVAILIGVSMYFNDFEPINFGSFTLCGYWLVTGAILLSESRELSPRVRRDLPSTLATRALFSCFAPGPSSGYLLAICAGSSAMLCFGVLSLFLPMRGINTPPMLCGMIMMGYLMCILGVVRLVTLPFSRRNKLSSPIVLTALAVVMSFCVCFPSIVGVLFTGSIDSDYSPIDVINWAWTSVEMFSYRSFDPFTATLPFVAGLIVTGLNMALMSDLFAFRRVAVPERVKELQDRESKKSDS